ncbi:hypothetical protein [Microcoleus sp. MON2_D5]|uniref:hypothetical protein n=1 Tax=Microcoleus sp. MON2_D5 TaxID=2818833 RepID=UPI002FD57395
MFTLFFTHKAEGKGTELGMFIGYQIVTEKPWGRWEYLSSLEEGTELGFGISI